jgi:hypothetical protein
MFSTHALIRKLLQLKTVIFLHGCLTPAVLLQRDRLSVHVDERLQDLLRQVLVQARRLRRKYLSGLYYKCFTIVIYDCNDSDQTTITVVIDDPS